MRTTVLNSNWEYKSENGFIVNVKDHYNLRSILTTSLQEGDDGITAWCVLDGKRLSYQASEKLKREIQGDEYNDWGEWTEEEIQAQDVEIYV